MPRKYHRILAAFTSEPWAIEESKFLAIVEFLEAQADGIKFDATEIEARIGKGTERAVAKQDGAVAVLPLHGVIMNRSSMLSNISGPGGTSSEAFGAMFKAALADPQVKAIVLDVNSPGGHVAGTEELSGMIHNARGQKPIIAHVNSLAASAAYWIATAADEMVVTPTGLVGSIGVMGQHENIAEKLKAEGVERTIIYAGKYKTEGSDLGPLTEEARAYMQGRVDEAYGMFVKAIARNRGVTQAAVRDGFGQGRVVGAEAAIKEGMADSVGTLDDVLARFAPPKRNFAMQREKRALSL